MMTMRVLIVEDEIMVAANLEAVLTDLGAQVVGIAADKKTALSLANAAPDIAFVDLNLHDGLTGPEIGALLAKEHGVTVVFMTANPRLVAEGVSGVLGVVTKPVTDDLLEKIVDFTVSARRGVQKTPPPSGVALFAQAG
jgi:two-component system, response regulator PdtaR